MVALIKYLEWHAICITYYLSWFLSRFHGYVKHKHLQIHILILNNFGIYKKIFPQQLFRHYDIYEVYSWLTELASLSLSSAWCTVYQDAPEV